MKGKRREPSASEVLAAIHRDALLDRVEAMTEEELHQDFLASGERMPTPEELRGQRHGELEAKPPSHLRVLPSAARKPAPPPSKPRRLLWPITTSVGVLAAAAALLLLLRRDPPGLITSDDVDASRGHEPVEDEREAIALRERAARACNDRRFEDCRDALDRAAELSPAGEAAGLVQALRLALAEAKSAADGGHPLRKLAPGADASAR